MFLLVGYLLD